jgi:hypothetical protein
MQLPCAVSAILLPLLVSTGANMQSHRYQPAWLRASISAALLSLTLAGCGGSGQGDSPTPVIPARAAQAVAALVVPGNVVVNPGFESATTTGWTVEKVINGVITIDNSTLGRVEGSGFVANSGAQWGRIGFAPPAQVERLQQNITVPSTGPQAKLEFWYNITSDETTSTVAVDTLDVEIANPTTGALVKRLGTLSNLDKASSAIIWRKSPQYDLSAYRGQTVTLRFVATNDASSQTVFRMDDISVAPLDSTAVLPQNGWWWNPLEGGRGFAIERQGYQLYLVGFLYDAKGAPLWMASTMSQQNDGSYAGAFSRYSGGQSLTGAFKQAAATSTPANVTVSFNTPTTASITFTPTDGGAERTVAIERFPISSPGFAAASANVGTGWYWNPAQGGRGFFIETQGTNAFVGSFMYDGTGAPIWYVNSPTLAGGNTLASALSSYVNGQTLTGNFVVPTLAPANPGSLAFAFTSPTAASMTLPGVVEPVALQNFVFNSTQRLRTVAAGSTKCLEVINDTNKNQIQMATCDGKSGQRWTVRPRTQGGIGEEIFNELAGKCLDVINDGTTSSSGLHLLACAAVTGQRWTRSPTGFPAITGAPTVTLTSFFTGPARCMSNSNAGMVVLENCGASSAQYWEFQ